VSVKKYEPKVLSHRIVKESLNLVPEIMQVLEAGEVAILPTDTSYALVANAFNPEEKSS
jgi:tRNA A37 threonylcarbamoyladenosine synthetase subunit TsaC/SUA5/YrdC